MRMKLKKEKKKKKKFCLLIIIFIMIITSTFYFIYYYSNKSIPLLLAYAEAETKKLTILVINKAVTKQINNIEVSEVFDIHYNDDGEIQLIDFNSQNTAKILSIMTSLVELNLRAIEEGKIDMLELPENSLSEYNLELLDKGIVLEDTRQGTKWKRA